MYQYKVKLVKVVDADTLDLEVDLGFEVRFTMRVRLFGIDAWEVRGEERKKGLEAKFYVIERLSKFEFFKIRTEKDKQGKYGRYLATILLPTGDGEIDLNAELVERGHAVVVNY